MKFPNTLSSFYKISFKDSEAFCVLRNRGKFENLSFSFLLKLYVFFLLVQVKAAI